MMKPFVAYDKAFAVKDDLVQCRSARLHSKMHICNWKTLEGELDHCSMVWGLEKQIRRRSRYLLLLTRLRTIWNAREHLLRMYFPYLGRRYGAGKSIITTKFVLRMPQLIFTNMLHLTLWLRYLNYMIRRNLIITAMSYGPDDQIKYATAFSKNHSLDCWL